MTKWRFEALWRFVLVGLAMVIAGPSLALTPDPFQSAPGPEAVKPKPRPRVAPQTPEAQPVAPAPAVAEAVPPGATVVASGAASPLNREMSWNKECEARLTPIIIAEQPRHGTLAIREETMPVPAVAAVGTSGACAGKLIMGRRLYYQSEPGFRGADRILYDVRYGNGEWHRKTVDIAVR